MEVTWQECAQFPHLFSEDSSTWLEAKVPAPSLGRETAAVAAGKVPISCLHPVPASV